LVYEFLERMRQHWSWWENNVPQVADICRRKLGHSRERAEFSARYMRSKFYPVDAKFERELQKLSDLYYQFKAISRPVRVASHLNGKYNQATVLL